MPLYGQIAGFIQGQNYGFCWDFPLKHHVIVTLATDELLCDKNAGAYVLIVSYLKITIKLKYKRDIKILGAI